MRVELTDGGSIRIDAETARRVGAADGALVRRVDGEVRLTILPEGTVGGLILKRIDPRGGRSVLVIEQIRDEPWDAGVREADWFEESRELRVPLRAPALTTGERT